MSCVFLFSFFFYLGIDHQRVGAPSSEQPQVFREHDLRQDGQTGRARAAAVCGPHRAHLRCHGTVRQTHPRGERRRSHGLLAGGGSLHRLCDLRDPAGVASCQIPDPEEEGFHLGDLTVVSRKEKSKMKLRIPNSPPRLGTDVGWTYQNHLQSRGFRRLVLCCRRPTVLAYIILCTFPCFAVLTVSSKVTSLTTSGSESTCCRVPPPPTFPRRVLEEAFSVVHCPFQAPARFMVSPSTR